MNSIKQLYHRTREKIYGVRPWVIPEEIASRMNILSDDQSQVLFECLRKHYFVGERLESYDYDFSIFSRTDVGREAIEDLMRRRLQTFRSKAIPWMNSLGGLSGKTVLEIGCGTGSATVALSEQGALVTAIDEDAGSLSVAKERAVLHQTQANFINANSSDAFAHYSHSSFDIVAFFAVLEHMTLDERLVAIRESWSLVKPGGLLVLIETPNRLWLEDSHTAMEDFYWWLPDDLAMLWSVRSSRMMFANSFTKDHLSENMAERQVRFSRWGRGVSYHEFCLALDCKPEELPVASAMELYFRKQRNECKIHVHMWFRRYESILHSRHSSIHNGFFLPYLDLAFRKV